MTPEEFAAEMRAIVDKLHRDPEEAHQAIDVLMGETLRTLGYGDGVDILDNDSRVTLWYA